MIHVPRIALLREKRLEILRIAALHGAYNVRIFGSTARGDDDDTSDIDFLVDMESGRSILDLGGFLADMEALLDLPIDVVTERAVRASRKNQILTEAIPL